MAETRSEATVTITGTITATHPPGTFVCADGSLIPPGETVPEGTEGSYVR